MPRTQQSPSHAAERWPSAPLDEWAETRDTLHMWTQIVGKIRLAQAPMVNHWWQVPLYVSTRGLTTSAIPYGERAFEMEFDFCDHQLHVRSSDGTAAPGGAWSRSPWPPSTTRPWPHSARSVSR